MVQACKDGDGRVHARHLQLPFRSEIHAVQLELGENADLQAAAMAADELPDLTRVIAPILAYDLDTMSEVSEGDKLTVLVEKRWLGQHLHRYGPVLALHYRNERGQLRYYRYKPVGGEDGYYDLAGKPGGFQEYLEVYERAGKACSRCRGTITKVKFAKANLFMCPDCQV